MRYTLSMLLVAIIFSASAQNSWKFSHITSDQGLSTGTVNCVFKDTKGFIWIGTIDGLNRYDGYSIKVYKTGKNDPNSISGNIVTSIGEDQSGNLWIGTRISGISIFDWKTERFTRLKTEDGLPEGAIRKFQFLEDGRVMIAVQGGGLTIYDPENGSFDVFTHTPDDPNSISSNRVFSIIPHVQNQFWIGTHSGGIDLFDVEKGTFKNYQYDFNFDLSETNRKPLLKDASGNLWIGTDGRGLVRFNPQIEAFRIFTKEDGLTSEIITTVFEGDNGNIFIGTDGGGINVYNPAQDQFFYLRSSLFDSESLSSDAIYEIYQDDSGVIWVSTFRGGVNVYSKFRNKFHQYEQIPFEENSLSFNSVIALQESTDGKIWIGTDGGGLDMLDPVSGKFEHFKHSPDNPNSISSNVPIAILEDSNGDLWIGTYAGGLNRFDRSTNTFTRYTPDPDDASSINSRNVWSLVEDSQGRLWAGLLDGGIDLYNPATDDFDHFTADGSSGSISSNFVMTMIEDSKENFWIGTEDAGLNLFDRQNKTFRVFKNDPDDAGSILNDNVRTLFEDGKGRLWIGTAEGLNIMNLTDFSITASGANELLPNHVINGILEDDDGYLWISTNKGISKYHPETNEIKNFGKSDGLQGNEFNYTSSLKIRNGRMYFGGVGGLNDFHPDEVKLSTFNPAIRITSIKVFDQSVTDIVDKNGKSFVETAVPLIEEITLNHSQNVLEIGFASLDYTSPQSNSYRYQLEGFDESRILTDAGKRTANYTNLDAGEYTFKVQGTNSDGVWSEETKTLKINILPPWWATWWFRLLMLLIIASSVFYVSRWRIRMIRKQKEELELRVEQATAQVLEKNEVLEVQQKYLRGALDDTNYVITEAVESGNFSARIDTQSKTGEWKDLGEIINRLFDNIQVPFKAINELSASMAESNLTNRFHGDSRGDVKRITDNLNHALDNLAGLLLEITDQTQLIGNSSEEMMVTSEEMNVNTKEISSSISEMSNGAQNQVQRIDEASQLIENILRFSEDVGDQAETINQAAEKGVGLSATGKELIARMDDSMKKMLEVSQETNRSIDVLSERSAEISRVLNIIKDIAVQTNMLALNAAIEAAKAGDAGRGFSVVAEEIGKLAEDSGRSTSEIERMIEEIQASIKNTTKLISEMNTDIEGGVLASGDASNSFEEIAASYAQTLGMSEQIVGVTKDQNESTKKVVEIMESVVVIAEQTAAGTEQIASSAQELSSGMTDYTDKTKSVREIVELLKEKVNQFKLKSDGVGEESRIDLK